MGRPERRLVRAAGRSGADKPRPSGVGWRHRRPGSDFVDGVAAVSVATAPATAPAPAPGTAMVHRPFSTVFPTPVPRPRTPACRQDGLRAPSRRPRRRCDALAVPKKESDASPLPCAATACCHFGESARDLPKRGQKKESQALDPKCLRSAGARKTVLTFGGARPVAAHKAALLVFSLLCRQMRVCYANPHLV